MTWENENKRNATQEERKSKSDLFYKRPAPGTSWNYYNAEPSFSNSKRNEPDINSKFQCLCRQGRYCLYSR